MDGRMIFFKRGTLVEFGGRCAVSAGDWAFGLEWLKLFSGRCRRFPIDSTALDVFAKRILLDRFEGFHIESVRERKFLKFRCDGLRLEGGNSPKREVDI